MDSQQSESSSAVLFSEGTLNTNIYFYQIEKVLPQWFGLCWSLLSLKWCKWLFFFREKIFLIIPPHHLLGGAEWKKLTTAAKRLQASSWKRKPPLPVSALDKRPGTAGTKKSNLLADHRITEWWRWEGVSGSHLIQPPCLAVSHPDDASDKSTV